MLCIILFVLSRYFSKLLAFNILFALSVTYLVSMNNFITEGYTERKKEEKNTVEKMTTKKKRKKNVKIVQKINVLMGNVFLHLKIMSHLLLLHLLMTILIKILQLLKWKVLLTI